MILNEKNLREMIAHAEDGLAAVKADDANYSVIPRQTRIREFELMLEVERGLLNLLEMRHDPSF